MSDHSESSTVVEVDVRQLARFSESQAGGQIGSPSEKSICSSAMFRLRGLLLARRLGWEPEISAALDQRSLSLLGR